MRCLRLGGIVFGVAVLLVLLVSFTWVMAQQEGQPAAPKPAAPTTPDQELFAQIEKLMGQRPEQGATEEENLKNIKDRLAKMNALCQEYINKYPTGPGILSVRAYQVQINYFLGSLAENKAAKDAAAREMEKLLTDHPGVEVIERLRATLFQHYMESDQSDQAVAHLSKFAETAIDERAARSARIILYQVQAQIGDFDGAKATLNTLIEKYPDSREASFAKDALKKLDRIGKPMELSYTSVDGKAVKVADYRGKVLLVDCWASWCPPCRAEMPGLVKLYNERNKDGFEIIGVSFDQEKQKMTDYAKETGMTWPEYFDGKGWENVLGKTLGVESIPASFLVDRNGVLRAVDLRGENLAKRVDTLLKEPATPAPAPAP